MTGREEFELWVRDGAFNLVDECVDAYGVTREQAALALADEMRAIAGEGHANTDIQRLDFLIDNQHMSLSPLSPKGERVVWDQSKGLVIAGRGANAREAIDNAMERIAAKVKV